MGEWMGGWVDGRPAWVGRQLRIECSRWLVRCEVRRRKVKHLSQLASRYPGTVA